MNYSTNMGRTRYFVPPGTRISVEVGWTTDTVVVRWPFAVRSDGIDTSEMRDVSPLWAAVTNLGHADRFEMAVVDVVAVVLEKFTFGFVQPYVSGALSRLALEAGRAPAAVIAADLLAEAASQRFMLPAWMCELLGATAPPPMEWDGEPRLEALGPGSPS